MRRANNKRLPLFSRYQDLPKVTRGKKARVKKKPGLLATEEARAKNRGVYQGDEKGVIKAIREGGWQVFRPQQEEAQAKKKLGLLAMRRAGA